MLNDHKYRWVFGPVVNNKHAAADYAIATETPMIFAGAALAYCVFNAHTLRAARKDPRLTVLPSLHSQEKIPDVVADHHAPQGVKRNMTMHDMLMQLAKVHSSYEPAA